MADDLFYTIESNMRNSDQIGSIDYRKAIQSYKKHKLNLISLLPHINRDDFDAFSTNLSKQTGGRFNSTKNVNLLNEHLMKFYNTSALQLKQEKCVITVWEKHEMDKK